MQVACKLRQQRRFKRRRQFHVNDVHQQQPGFAGVNAALEDMQRCGLRPGQGQRLAHQRSQIFGGMVKPQLELGESDHGQRLYGLGLSSRSCEFYVVDKVFEVSKRHKAQQLCKHRSTRVHTENLEKRGNSTPARENRVSNRLNRESVCKPHVACVSTI